MRSSPGEDGKLESRKQSTSILDMDLLAKEAEHLANPQTQSDESTSMTADLTDSQFQLIGYGEELDMELEAMNDAINRRAQRKNVLKQNPRLTSTQKHSQTSLQSQGQMSVLNGWQRYK